MVSRDKIASQLGNCLLEAKFPQWENCYQQGKVRDMYLLNGKRILITTDRQSAFDHVLGAIPLKGQALNRTALWWFAQTADIVESHVIDSPDPNVMVVKEVKILPVEVVVRAYITGSTSTSLWVNYSEGRDPYGLNLPPGIKKNSKLDYLAITPTTKSDVHDEPLSVEQVTEREIMDPEIWENVQRIALKLFMRGTELAAERGLILVDTKYEMGIDPATGRITLADEVHTPDSSRYWKLDSYEERLAHGEEPESLDKEFLRLWLTERGISDDNIPKLDNIIRIQVAERYIELFERMTGETFVLREDNVPILERIEKNIAPYMNI